MPTMSSTDVTRLTTPCRAGRRAPRRRTSGARSRGPTCSARGTRLSRWKWTNSAARRSRSTSWPTRPDDEEQVERAGRARTATSTSATTTRMTAAGRRCRRAAAAGCRGRCRASRAAGRPAPRAFSDEEARQPAERPPVRRAAATRAAAGCGVRRTAGERAGDLVDVLGRDARATTVALVVGRVGSMRGLDPLDERGPRRHGRPSCTVFGEDQSRYEGTRLAAARGVPTATIRPPSSKRHPVGERDGRRPVHHDERGRASAARGAARASTSASVWTSSADSGSSSTSTRGRPMIARASASRCRWPPDRREALLADPGVEPPRQVVDELGLRDLERARRCPRRSRRGSRARGSRARCGEQRRAPRTPTPTCAPQRREREVAHVVAVERDPSRGHVVEAGHERHERGLARTGRADERDRLARRDLEVDAAQHGALVARVTRSARLRTAPRRRSRRDRRRVGPVGDRRHGVEHLVDARRPRSRLPRAMARIHAQRLDRPHEHEDEGDERDQAADRERPAADRERAGEEHRSRA